MNRTYGSFRYSISQQLTNDEKRVDYQVASDSDVNYRGIVKLEMHSNHDLLERI